jgi:hypothetical protein
MSQNNTLTIEIPVSELLPLTIEERNNFIKESFLDKIRYDQSWKQGVAKEIIKGIAKESIKEIIQDSLQDIKQLVSSYIQDKESYRGIKWDISQSAKEVIKNEVYGEYKDKLKDAVAEKLADQSNQFFRDIIGYELGNIILETLVNRHADL